MAWGVFDRPRDASFVGERHNRRSPWSIGYPPSQPPPPPPPPKKQFRTPLAQTVFNDPAFSSDPRSHPHFTLADARSYKDLPPKPPHRSHDPSQENIPCLVPPVLPHHPATVDRRLSPLALSVSLEHEPTLTSSSSTVSSTTSHSSSPTQTPGIYTMFSGIVPQSLRPIPHTKFTSTTLAHHPPDEVRPRIPYTMSTSTPDMRPPPPPPPPTRANSAPALPVTRKKSDKIKNFVRRLTKKHDNLDRIDELDETDPFGIGFHHSGPYEAITNNLAKLVPPHSDADGLTQRMQPLKRKANRASAPLPTRMAINGSPLPGDIFAETDNTSNEGSSHNVQIETVPIPGRHHHEPAASNIRPDHFGTQIPRDQSANFLGSYPSNNKGFPSHPALRMHYSGDIIPHAHGVAPSHMNSVSAPYVPDGGKQFTTTIRKPGLHTPSPPPSPRQPPLHTPNLVTQPIQPLTDSPPRQAPLPRSVRSLDIHHIHDAQPADSRNKPPRVQHLPKRLVMPAPLQTQPQSQPPAPSRQLRYVFPKPDNEVHVGHPIGINNTKMLGVNRGRNLLRKRTASLPGIAHLPVQSSVGTGPTMRRNPSATALEGERTQKGTRRRLSKRKVDI